MTSRYDITFLTTDLDTPLQKKKQRQAKKTERNLGPCLQLHAETCPRPVPILHRFGTSEVRFACQKKRGKQFGHEHRRHPIWIINDHYISLWMASKPGHALCSPKPESETIHEISRNHPKPESKFQSGPFITLSFLLCHALLILQSDIMLLRSKATHKAKRLETPSHQWTA